MAAKDDLAALINSEMTSSYGHPCNVKFSKALAAAIIDYFESKAKVNVSSVSGVTPGPGVSGPGTGTITFI